MFREFFEWWIGQLADLVPAGWSRLGATRKDALVIEPVGSLPDDVDDISVNLRRRGRESLVGRYSLAAASLAQLPRPPGRRWVLRLRQSDVLAKTVTLPIAAERQVREALAFQMDQETPFTPDEIYWSHFIAERDRQAERLSVRLLLVPRESLRVLLGALDRLGVVPNRAEIADGPDQGQSLPLGSDGDPLNGGNRRPLLWPAAAVCLLLALGTIATPFIRQAISMASIEDEIEAQRATAAEVEKLRKELDRLSGTIQLVESERDKAGRPIATLATLTRLLPDDTYLTELTEQQRKVTLSGSSAGAARLIGALSAGDGLRNVAFAAPVTRLETTRTEVFTIAAEVAP
jgi:general secretion pathway protein L